MDPTAKTWLSWDLSLGLLDSKSVAPKSSLEFGGGWAAGGGHRLYWFNPKIAPPVIYPIIPFAL